MLKRTTDKTLRYERRVGFFFLLPTFLVFIVFKYFPMLENFRISMTKWNLFTAKKWVGLKNYQTLFASAEFWQILRNTFFYAIVSTAISIIIGFLVAVALHRRKGFFPKFLKTLFFIPNVTTASAVAILWMWIFDPDFGLSGQIFTALGLQSPRWLLTPGYAMWVVISLSVWRSIGYVMLIYSSGMAGISEDIYEASQIDGASKARTMFSITIPLLRPTSYFLILTSVIQAMQVFDIISVMTGGGPYNSTNVLNLYIYQQAFMRNRAGLASAISVVLFFILLFCTLVQRKIKPERD